MLIDRNSSVHLYIQVADSIRRTITSGGFPVGSVLPTEEDLCRLYGVSRFPMRQAMDMLVREGYLRRVRGKGTFVTDPAQSSPEARGTAERKRLIALVLPVLLGDYPLDILRGFEKTAGEAGYSVIVAVSGGAEEEIGRIESALDCGAAGVVLFPYSRSTVTRERLEGWAGSGVYFSLIDRNNGLEGVDYIGSDNSGGGYMAAFHLKHHGFENVLFVSDAARVSSVVERLEGFRNGVRHFGMNLLNGEAAPGGSEPDYAACSVEGFAERVGLYAKRLPFGIFAANDPTAARVMEILEGRGIAVGAAAGVIGFDNSSVCERLSPGLTSVAQNGFLIGETAARIAVEKLESGSREVVRHILPTQLAIRQSCGEGRG